MIVAQALLLFLLLAAPSYADAATAAECAALHEVDRKLPCGPSTKVTPADQTILQLNKGADAPHAYLKSKATTGANIGCLQPEFAKKAAAFLKAAEAAGKHPKIDSGYRGRAAQEAAKAKGASKVGWCASPHNYGLAIDMNLVPKSEWAWFRANAATYGLKTIGTWDPMHFQDAAGKSGQCGACANDSGDGALPGNGGSGAPGGSDGIGGALRSLMSKLGGGSGSGGGSSGGGGSPSAPSGATNPGTAPITQAFTPPTPSTPTTPTVNTPTPADIVIPTTITATTSTTTQNSLSPTTVIRLAQEKKTVEQEPVIVLPPPIATPPQRYTSSNSSTFAEGRFIDDGENFEETHALPTDAVRAPITTGFGAMLTQLKNVLEGILVYLAPFSTERYGNAIPEGYTEEPFYFGEEWATDDPAALFDDGFEFPQQQSQ